MQEMSHRQEYCTNCGKAFSDGICANLVHLPGYWRVILCDDCASRLLADKVAESWMKEGYDKPAPAEKLWRYMDLAKLIHLLSTGKLYLQ